jgi:hypothetical protein
VFCQNPGRGGKLNPLLISAHVLHLQAMLELAGAPQLAAGGASWAVNERQAEALVRAHEAFMRVGGLGVAG